MGQNLTSIICQCLAFQTVSLRKVFVTSEVQAILEVLCLLLELVISAGIFCSFKTFSLPSKPLTESRPFTSWSFSKIY